MTQCHFAALATAAWVTDHTLLARPVETRRRNLRGPAAIRSRALFVPELRGVVDAQRLIGNDGGRAEWLAHLYWMIRDFGQGILPVDECAFWNLRGSGIVILRPCEHFCTPA